MRKDKSFPEVNILITLKRCSKIEGTIHHCPFMEVERTKNAGFAFDYFCVHPEIGKKEITGYVEYSSDEVPIPDWCPIRLDGEEAKARTKQKLIDMIGGADI